MLRDLCAYLSQHFHRLTTPQRLSSLHIEKVIDHLAERHMPLGTELTDTDRRLIGKEIERAQNASPGSLKRLSDVVDRCSASGYRCVREFAQHCVIEEASDRGLDNIVFLETHEKASPAEKAFVVLAAIVVATGWLVRCVLTSFAPFLAAWLVVVGCPFLFALFSPAIDTADLAHSLGKALDLTIARWDLFYDSGVIGMTFVGAIFLGMIRFVRDSMAGKIW